MLVLNFGRWEGSGPVRFLIVDDSEAWRRKVYSSLLQQYPDCESICEAVDGLAALQRTEELQYDLIVLDIGLPRLSGIEAARQICVLAPGPKILFLTAVRCSDVALEALRIGAGGYVLKENAAYDLLPAVKAVLEGGQFVSRGLAACDPGCLPAD